MNIYADYDYYVNDYGGKLIKVDEFDRYAKEASMLIDTVTLSRLNAVVDIPEQVKMAACKVAEVSLREYKENNEDQIASETVGPHSVSYAKKNKSSEEYTKEKLRIISTYLSNTGLLYRGLMSWNS